MATEIDEKLGEKLREIRTMQGHSQSTIAEAIGVTFQQIQKYEKGSNRLSASRMYDLCKFLGITPNDLFVSIDDLEQTPDQTILRRETMELVRTWSHIKNPDAKAGLMRIMRTLSDEKNPLAAE